MNFNRQEYIHNRNNKAYLLVLYSKINKIIVEHSHILLVLPYVEWDYILSYLDNYFSIKMLSKDNTILKVW